MKRLNSKRNYISQLLLLVLIALTTACFGQDVRQKTLAATTVASGIDPEATDELFVNGSGDDFDQYLFRSDVPNGRLAFHVDITRYYSTLMKFNSSGFLTNAQELIQKGLIPKTARLTLRVFDVDHDSQVDINGDGIADPEVDYVYVNGKQISTGNGSPWKLSSGNDTWSTPSILIPIEYLKFPRNKGTTTTKPKSENLIEIEVDVTNTGGWAVECDYIKIGIENKIRPIVLVRGFGVSSGGTAGSADKAWKVFAGFLEGDGIPYHIAQSIDQCGGIIANGINLGNEVQEVLNMYGVDKVNLIGHSKGGLDSRAYLRASRQAENLIQLGPPNHGSGLAYFSAGCQPAGDQLQPNWLADNFNYLDRHITKPLYLNEIASGTKVHLLAGSEDNVVSLERATLPYPGHAIYTKGDLTKPDNIDNDGQFPLGHSALRESHAVYESAIQFIAPGLKTVSRAKIQHVQTRNTAKINTDSLVLISSAEDILSASVNKILQVYIAKEGAAVFQILFEDSSATVNLQSPSGVIYDSSDPEFSREEIFGGLITYTIDNAEKGSWQVALKGGNSSGLTSLHVYAKTDRSLLINTGGKSRFAIGDPIPIKATFMQGSLPLLNADVVLYHRQTLKTDSLQLFDDGLHNDGNANDGIYGNQIPGFQNAGTASLIIKAEQGPESIYSEDVLTILPASAEFTNTYQENALDVNSDGYYDSLQIKVGVNIRQAGRFMVTAILRDAKDSVITLASWNSSHGGSQSPGVYEVPLNFSGNEIGRNGVDGPYKLDDLVLTDLNYDIPLSYLDNSYNTKSYRINQFPRPPIELTGNSSEAPVDSDSDGDYDFLDIKFQIKVNKAGRYSISAELTDSLQNDLNWTTNNLNLNEGLNEISLRFNGQEINEKLSNGPYVLTNLNLFSESFNTDVTFYDVHKTASYTFSEFTGNIVSGVVKDSISGLPVKEAEVFITGPKLANVKTDSTGHFAIGGLPNGYYNLRARKENFCDAPTININVPHQTLLELALIPRKFSIRDKDTIGIVEGESLTIAAPTGWEVYKWSTGETTNSIVVRKAGTYYLKTSLGNCQAISDSITVTVQANRCPQDITIIALSCSNDSTVISWVEPKDTFPATIGIPPFLDPGNGNLSLIGGFDGHGYYKSDKDYLWPQASDISEFLGGTGVKGYLATISNQAENDFISNAIKGSGYPWIGLFSSARPNRFRWVTNETLDYTNWRAGEPNNFGGNAQNVAQPYVHLIDSTGKWGDTSSVSLRFVAEFEKPLIRYKQVSGPRNGSTRKVGTYMICYERTNLITDIKDTCCFTVTVTCPSAFPCPKDTVILTSSCSSKTVIAWTEPKDGFPGSINIPVGLDPGNGALNLLGSFEGHGYYRSNNGYLWPVARDISEFLGGAGVKGHLATLTSAAENNFIYNKLKGTGHQPWIGLFSTGRPGRFRWVTNENLGYTNWAPGQPSNTGGNATNVAEPYVHMVEADGTWNDWVNYNLSFISEFDKPLIKYKQVFGPKNGSLQSPGVYLICYERTNLITDLKDTCCFTLTVRCSELPTLQSVEKTTPIVFDDTSPETSTSSGLSIVASPGTDYFKLKVISNSEKQVNLQIRDVLGRVLEAKNGLITNKTFEIGRNFKPGLYFAEISKGTRTVAVKLVKLNAADITTVQGKVGKRPGSKGLGIIPKPNPSNNYFTLTILSNSEEGINLQVLDASGKLMETKNNITPNQSFKIGGLYKPGVYFAQAIQENNKITVKLIKQ